MIDRDEDRTLGTTLPFDLSPFLGQDALGRTPQNAMVWSTGLSRVLCRVVAASLLLNGCATGVPPRPHFDEDQHGRYYETRSGTILRVEQDGTVLDVTCAEPMLAKGFPREDVLRIPCPTGKVSVLGKAKKLGTDWDLSTYLIDPESGTCVSLFAPLSDAWTAEKRRSCAHRIWEIPAAVVATLAGALDYAGRHKAVIDRFNGREGMTEIDQKWAKKVTDVRNGFVFAAAELFGVSFASRRATL